jgi:hypothetical protein
MDEFFEYTRDCFITQPNKMENVSPTTATYAGISVAGVVACGLLAWVCKLYGAGRDVAVDCPARFGLPRMRLTIDANQDGTLDAAPKVVEAGTVVGVVGAGDVTSAANLLASAVVGGGATAAVASSVAAAEPSVSDAAEKTSGLSKSGARVRNLVTKTSPLEGVGAKKENGAADAAETTSKGDN